MEAVGKYYRTIIRDEATAETEFDLSYISGDCAHICKNGLLRCVGKISIMSSGMSNSSKREAETINKMLNIRPYGDKLHGKNANDPVEGDFIIVDEVSMLGTKLASCLLSAVKTGAILLLVGDENQLQSVEYGNVLQDLIRSNVVEVYRLNEIMRQTGAICENALLINKGVSSLIKDDSFHVYECSEEEAMKKLFQLMKKPDTQILSSVKGGMLGTRCLNREIQKMKNRGRKICLLYKQQPFYEQDSIILTETNYEKGYFNGDIGKIIGRNEDGLLVEFESKVLCLDQGDFHVMELAYVITTHKSQGTIRETIDEDKICIFIPEGKNAEKHVMVYEKEITKKTMDVLQKKTEKTLHLPEETRILIESVYGDIKRSNKEIKKDMKAQERIIPAPKNREFLYYEESKHLQSALDTRYSDMRTYDVAILPEEIISRLKINPSYLDLIKEIKKKYTITGISENRLKKNGTWIFPEVDISNPKLLQDTLIFQEENGVVKGNECQMWIDEVYGLEFEKYC